MDDLAPPAPAKVVAQAIRRASRDDYRRWEAMVRASGCCAQPVRLAGRVLSVDPGSGEVSLAYSTVREAEGVLLKACGTRRATLCPACAATYRADAKALLRAGLAIPDRISHGARSEEEPDSGVGGPPVVFVTLTAPSFGLVHRSTDGDGPCRLGRGGCEHGVALACPQSHPPGDGALGAAICPECYDWQAAVMFNARAGELWRRTIIAVARRLAGLAGLAVSRLRDHYRLEFAKVIEFQARGVVHIHALARLDHFGGADARPGSGRAVTNRAGLDGEALAAAFMAAAVRTSAPNPLDPARPITWGHQVDVEVIPARRRRAAAAYLAKYATKSVDGAGLLDRRLRHGDLSNLGLPEHLSRMAATAWELGGRPDLEVLNLRAWAHSLGYRGHWLTKSRHWSTTFGELRSARRRWTLAQLGITPEEEAKRWGEWDYRGVGHSSAGDAWLAASANAARRQSRRSAWEET